MSTEEQAATATSLSSTPSTPTIVPAEGLVPETPVFPGRVRDDGVVVLPEEEPEVTKGGIHRPESYRKRPRVGRVVSVGPGKHNEAGVFVKSDVKVGDRVLYGRYSGEEIEVKFRGKPCTLLRLADCRVVLDGDAEVVS